eukprot:TRINITY_DN72395_c0_g1_i1.p1 TRINITY_DN72395_c0_g1~~TRINITY_DN72395_c0_g1_i1.p1  ORF type:complete len:413 (+),score=77.68 TRINITY_DN72395_c0_g1_i1:118-1239(+)
MVDPRLAQVGVVEEYVKAKPELAAAFKAKVAAAKRAAAAAAARALPTKVPPERGVARPAAVAKEDASSGAGAVGSDSLQSLLQEQMGVSSLPLQPLQAAPAASKPPAAATPAPIPMRRSPHRSRSRQQPIPLRASRSRGRGGKRARTSFKFTDEARPEAIVPEPLPPVAQKISRGGFSSAPPAILASMNARENTQNQGATGFGQHVLKLTQLQIRCLLGKGGANVQTIMRQTGAQIVVRTPPFCDEGVVTVSGNYKPAVTMIEQLMFSKGCPVTNGFDPSIPGIFEVPMHLIGQLVGKTAFFVQVQARFGDETLIQKLPRQSPSGNRYVQIAGEHWMPAKEMVIAWLQQLGFHQPPKCPATLQGGRHLGIRTG